jgi:hypothetical protein
VIIGIAVHPVVESRDRMKGSDLRDGDVLMPTQLGRFVNNEVEVCLTERDLRISLEPVGAYAMEGVIYFRILSTVWTLLLTHFFYAMLRGDTGGGIKDRHALNPITAQEKMRHALCLLFRLLSHHD